MEDRRIGIAEFARLAGIRPKTLTSYMARGQVIAPDGREEISNTPWWWLSRARHWIANRPRAGVTAQV